jgi:HD-GYP domain-containing protein (c-di-GMP phosphodiesterase class II)
MMEPEMSNEGKALSLENVGATRKLQILGKRTISAMYMLVRNVKMYAPDNEIFIQPLEALRQDINWVVSLEGQYSLKSVGTSVFLNNTQLQIDFGSLDNIRYMTDQFKDRGVGGFQVDRPIQVQELRNFIAMFSANMDGHQADEDGVDGHRLKVIKVGKFGRILEQLQNIEDAILEEERKVDRKKYALTVYARSIYFMRKYFEAMAAGETLPNEQALSRLVQDFVDISSENRAHFLGLTTTKSTDDYLEYHSVNTCLIAIIFGQEMHMSRAQLFQLGLAAVFHAIGMATLDKRILQKPDALTIDERAEIDLFPLHSVKNLLTGENLNQEMVHRVVAVYESHVDYSYPMKDKDGKVELVTPQVDLSLFGRIIAIASVYDALSSARPYREAYGPELAMCLMIHDLKYKFDPFLLRVFMKVMAIQPVQVMEGDHSIQLG